MLNLKQYLHKTPDFEKITNIIT